MNNTLPPASPSMPMQQQPTPHEDLCYPERGVIYAFGVVLLLFGTAITGHHQVSIVGFVLIVLCNLI